jgi:hypothetical protein
MYYCVYYSCAICVILVMCIWVYLQVLEMWDFGSILKSRQASSAKPSQAISMGRPLECSQSTWLREDVESVYFWKRPGWTDSQQHHQHYSRSRVSEQAMIGKPPFSKRHNNIICLFKTRTDPSCISQIKNNL